MLFLSLMLAGPALTYIQGQEAHASVNATGGNANSANGSVSYSVGQVFYTTAFSTNGSISEGVQQPFEISVLSDLISSTYFLKVTKDNKEVKLFKIIKN